METTNYSYEKQLVGVSFDTARTNVNEALAAEGFGVLTEIDVKKTLKKKLDVEFRRYVILGACNPNLAHRALEAEPQIGLLLPCNVVVQEVDVGSVVSIANPWAMFSLVGNSEMDPLVSEVDERLRRVFDALSLNASG